MTCLPISPVDIISLLLLDICEADIGASYFLLHSEKENGILDSNPCPCVSHLKSMSFSLALPNSTAAGTLIAVLVGVDDVAYVSSPV